MALFMRQYDNGYGDYTAEREDLLKDVTLEEVELELAENQSTTVKKKRRRISPAPLLFIMFYRVFVQLSPIPALVRAARYSL